MNVFFLNFCPFFYNCNCGSAVLFRPCPLKRVPVMSDGRVTYPMWVWRYVKRSDNECLLSLLDSLS